MKKILFVSLILATMLGMSNCENDGGKGGETGNPFVGAWEEEKAGGYLFTETEMKRYYFDTLEDRDDRKGAKTATNFGTATYVYDDKNLTVTWPEDSIIGRGDNGDASKWLTDDKTQKVFVIPYDFSNGYKLTLKFVYEKVKPPKFAD